MDLNLAPQYDTPLWNETRFNSCWNGDEGVGLYIHYGRRRGDLDVWFAQVVIYLQDRELCVQRFFGPNASEAGIELGGLTIQIVEDGWRAAFNGIAQLTTIEGLASAAQGSSVPLRHIKFTVTAEAVAPEWDMYSDSDYRFIFAGDTQVQQCFKTTGELQVEEAGHRLDGVGFKDHSTGTRDFGPWHSHRFFMIPHRDWTCQAVVMYSPDGEPEPPWGVFFRDGEKLRVTGFELPVLEDAVGGPLHGECVIEIETGESFTFESELLHAFPTVMTEDNDNINGIDWESGGNPIVVIEGTGRLTEPDGTVTQIFHERSARRNALPRPAS